jgi:hypothetical protein
MAQSTKKREQPKPIHRNTRRKFAIRMSINHEILNRIILEEALESKA